MGWWNWTVVFHSEILRFYVFHSEILRFYVFLKVISRLDAENLRSRKYLHPSSYGKVKKECENRMVADHLPFLHFECKGAVVEEREKGTAFHLVNLLCIYLRKNIAINIKSFRSRGPSSAAWFFYFNFYWCSMTCWHLQNSNESHR